MGGGGVRYEPNTSTRLGRSPRGRGRLTKRNPRDARQRSIPAWAGETHAGRSSKANSVVDPRVGGGDRPRPLRLHPPEGRSPRGRGRRRSARSRRPQRGSIPAWAGETRGNIPSQRDCPVDPRVGGGDASRLDKAHYTAGRSPRGRGRPRRRQGRRLGGRSIPAWAGETWMVDLGAGGNAVDPRVGGGDSTGQRIYADAMGRSPRGRGRLEQRAMANPLARSIPAWAGETYSGRTKTGAASVDPRVGGGDPITKSVSVTGVGRSPRGRGRPADTTKTRRPRGSIPAWAGETTPRATRPMMPWVDPRVGGGDWGCRTRGRGPRGRSPRGRGRPPDAQVGAGQGRSIPAWAGETRGKRRRQLANGVDPRVGGGDALRPPEMSDACGRSPRGRGRPNATTAPAARTRSIPAWAGETRPVKPRRNPSSVDPRVGGGDPLTLPTMGELKGRSPRGRGRQCITAQVRETGWSIPAWAGETRR